MAGTTFEKYGGFSTVSRIVMDFYERVLDNDEVGHHFDDIDMPRLMDHQTKFISSLLGGPSAMGDDRLRAVHQKLDITDAEFDEVVILLTAALRDHGMNQEDIQQVGAEIEARRSLIVGGAIS